MIQILLTILTISSAVVYLGYKVYEIYFKKEVKCASCALIKVLNK